MWTDSKPLASWTVLILALILLAGPATRSVVASTTANQKENQKAPLSHNSVAKYGRKATKKYQPLQWFKITQRIGIGGPPSQVEPELRSFVTQVSLKIRDRWLAVHKPTLQPVYVSFYRDGEEVYVNGDDDDEAQSRTAAENLVRTALKGVHPPKGKIYQGYAVNIFFESYPDKKTPDPRLGAGYKKHTFEPAILYSDMLVAKVRSNWKSDLPALKERESYDATVRVAVKSDGSLDSLKIISGSGPPRVRSNGA